MVRMSRVQRGACIGVLFECLVPSFWSARGRVGEGSVSTEVSLLTFSVSVATMKMHTWAKGVRGRG